MMDRSNEKGGRRSCDAATAQEETCNAAEIIPLALPCKGIGDARWFAQYPWRKYRLREAFTHEPLPRNWDGSLGMRDAPWPLQIRVVVRRGKRGELSRAYFFLHPADSGEENTSEAAARFLFQVYQSNGG
jgi:hypothetical protein